MTCLESWCINYWAPRLYTGLGVGKKEGQYLRFTLVHPRIARSSNAPSKELTGKNNGVNLAPELKTKRT